MELGEEACHAVRYPHLGHPQVTCAGSCSSSSGHVGCKAEAAPCPPHQAPLPQGLLPGVWLSLAEFFLGTCYLGQSPSAREVIIKPHLVKKEAEAQRGEVTCSRPHSHSAAQAGGQPTSKRPLPPSTAGVSGASRGPPESTRTTGRFDVSSRFYFFENWSAAHDGCSWPTIKLKSL